MAQVSYQAHKSATHPHVEWLELYGDQMLHECAVMQRDSVGNVMFFRINDLDSIDKNRLIRILADRQARSMALWDLMSTHTLPNGVNALEYFSQLTNQLTVNGRVVNPRSGQVGAIAGVARA